MNASNTAIVHLERASADRGMVRIPHARGVRVTCLSGELWITEDRSSEDIVLTAGKARTLQSPGLALVTALETADVRIDPESTAYARASMFAPTVRDHLRNHAHAQRRDAAREWGRAFSQRLHRMRVRLTHPSTVLKAH
jgi:DUF2917 family protein